MSELNRRLERELSAQKAALGEEHKKQISLIKQVESARGSLGQGWVTAPSPGLVEKAGILDCT